jgi:non-canonical purine NTP pyrophosphatase (RdgB/HAM1 family)
MSLRPAFTLITSSPAKAGEIGAILGFALPSQSVDLPEIQSLNLREILAEKARTAFARTGAPVVVEDVSLEMNGWNGFPGPLVKWLLKAAGPAGLIAAARASGDSRARAVCGVLAFDGGREWWFEGVVEGTIAPSLIGASGFGWDPVFIPAGHDTTFAGMTAEEKNAVSHRGAAWRKFKEWMESR